MTPARSRTGAFTIVEMLLVISIIGLLLSLLLPSLAGVREQARKSVDLSNLRSHTQSFSNYTIDWDGMWPFFTDPTQERTELVYREHRQNTLYFGATIYWNFALADYYGGQLFHPSMYPPQDDDWYYYSQSFIARPEYWNAFTRRGPAQWKPTRASEVKHASAKGLLLRRISIEEWASIDSHPDGGTWAHRITDYRVGFVDGSAGQHAVQDLEPGYLGGDGRPEWQGVVTTFGFPISHTIDGVRGRDLP